MIKLAKEIKGGSVATCSIHFDEVGISSVSITYKDKGSNYYADYREDFEDGDETVPGKFGNKGI